MRIEQILNFAGVDKGGQAAYWREKSSPGTVAENMGDCAC